jgi:hypothetical protein
MDVRVRAEYRAPISTNRPRKTDSRPSPDGGAPLHRPSDQAFGLTGPSPSYGFMTNFTAMVSSAVLGASAARD